MANDASDNTRDYLLINEEEKVKHKFKQKNKIQLLVLAMTIGFSATAQADIGVSLKAATNNEYKNLEDDAIALLGLEYRGEKFNLGKDGISYDFTNSNDYAVEAFLTSKNYGYEAKDSKTFKGMDDRRVSVDLGGRLIMDSGVGPIVFDITKDVNLSKGFEAGLKVGGITPHAPHWNGKRELKVAATASVRYKSDKTVDYFYGVKNAEATANRKAYKGKSATIPYIGVEAQANITKHVSFTGDIGVTKRASSIRNSPLTTDKEYETVANIGITYWF